MPLLTAKRDPTWIGCIDFGTALSKFAMVKAVDRAELQSEYFRPLAIAARPDVSASNKYLLPSVVFVSGTHLLFGQEAYQAALRAEHSGRQAFVSPKQYLSTHDAEDLDHPLPREIDPTAKFTARDLLTLFLAHVLERAGDDAKQERLPWPVPLRIARPAWKAQRARDGEKILKGLVQNGFALVDKLGSKLSTKGGPAIILICSCADLFWLKPAYWQMIRLLEALRSTWEFAHAATRKNYFELACLLWNLSTIVD